MIYWKNKPNIQELNAEDYDYDNDYDYDLYFAVVFLLCVHVSMELQVLSCDVQGPRIVGVIPCNFLCTSKHVCVYDNRYNDVKVMGKRKKWMRMRKCRNWK